MNKPSHPYGLPYKDRVPYPLNEAAVYCNEAQHDIIAIFRRGWIGQLIMLDTMWRIASGVPLASDTEHPINAYIKLCNGNPTTYHTKLTKMAAAINDPEAIVTIHRAIEAQLQLIRDDPNRRVPPVEYTLASWIVAYTAHPHGIGDEQWPTILMPSWNELPAAPREQN